MKFENRLQDYDEHSFLSLVTCIWNAENNRAEHNSLIEHFDQIIGHPAGSDLLFYSTADETGNVNSPAYIVSTIKSWHQQSGRVAFKGQILQAPPVRQSLTREQRATESSNRNLEKVRQLVAEIHAAEQQATLQLAALEQQLAIDPVASSPEQQLAASLAALQALESIQHQAKRSVGQLERLQMPVKFTREGAVRDASSTFLNAGIQAVVLQEINAGSQRHAAALAMAQGCHPALYARGVTLIESLEARIAQLAKALANGPGHEPLTLTAAAHSASLYPALLTARGLSREVAQQQHRLTRTFRSALAELEWQASSMQSDHPGTYADVVEFVLSTPSDDPRFALTVPLIEMLDGELLDWAALAAAQAEVELPVRLCSMVTGARSATTTGVKPFTRYSHVVMTSTLGAMVPSGVRVRAARWDVTRQELAFTSDGEAPVTVLWQKDGISSVREELSRPPGIGYLRMPEVPVIERFADLSQLRFDDYVVVFPPETGMAPLYMMFRDRREF